MLAHVRDALEGLGALAAHVVALVAVRRLVLRERVARRKRLGAQRTLVGALSWKYTTSVQERMLKYSGRVRIAHSKLK